MPTTFYIASTPLSGHTAEQRIPRGDCGTVAEQAEIGAWIQPVPREMLPSLSTAAQKATVAQEIAVKPLNTLAG
jgi:hypothetical protein